MSEEKKNFIPENEEEFLKKVEKAATKGALKAGKIKTIIISALVIALVIFGYVRYHVALNNMKSLFEFGSVEGHDLTLQNMGILGYTTADFEDAVLGYSSKVSKLEVFTQEMSDEVTVESAGFAKWKIFTSKQNIKYKGTAVYTVDLSGLSGASIEVDNDANTVTISIPHAVQEAININENDMEIGSTEKGFLRFSEIEITIAQIKEVQAKAREKMQIKLDEQKTLEVADTYALKSVKELYEPMIRAIAKGYNLEIKFTDAQ